MDIFNSFRHCRTAFCAVYYLSRRNFLLLRLLQRSGDTVLSDDPRRGSERQSGLEPPYRPGHGHDFKLQLLSAGQSVFLDDDPVPKRICPLPYRAAADFEVCVRCERGVHIPKTVRQLQRLCNAWRTALRVLGLFDLQRVLFPLPRADDRFSAAACSS